VVDRLNDRHDEAKDLAQAVVGDFHRTGRRRRTRRWLKERRGHRGVKGHVPFHFLHHLMDVPVEDRDGTESLQI
jgi:hypothetical protein